MKVRGPINGRVHQVAYSWTSTKKRIVLCRCNRMFDNSEVTDDDATVTCEICLRSSGTGYWPSPPNLVDPHLVVDHINRRNLMGKCQVRGCNKPATDVREDNNHNYVNLCKDDAAALDDDPDNFVTVFGKEVIEIEGDERGRVRQDDGRSRARRSRSR